MAFITKAFAGLQKRQIDNLLAKATGTVELGSVDAATSLTLHARALIKHHAHALTGDYAYQLRTECNKATGDFFGMDAEVHAMINRTAGGIRGLSMTGRIQASKTLSGTSNLIPGHFLLDVDGTINGTGLFAALVAKVDAGGTFTALSHLASLWVDSLQEGTVNGEHELIYMTNNGASQMDQAIYLYAGNKITRLFAIDTAAGMVGDAADGDYTFTKTRKIKVKLGGEDYYLIADQPAA
jgi:hypothetical protein